MISLDVYRAQWFGSIRADVLAGLVVALALIPEAIAFSIIAGVDPKVCLLYTSPSPRDRTRSRMPSSA